VVLAGQATVHLHQCQRLNPHQNPALGFTLREGVLPMIRALESRLLKCLLMRA